MDGKIYHNDASSNCPETSTNAEIQKLIDAYDAEIDAKTVTNESNAEIIACIDDQDADVAAQVEIDEEELAELENRLAKFVTPKPVKNAPSVKEIFLKVTADAGTKATDKGKDAFDIYKNEWGSVQNGKAL